MNDSFQKWYRSANPLRFLEFWPARISLTKNSFLSLILSESSFPMFESVRICLNLNSFSHSPMFESVCICLNLNVLFTDQNFESVFFLYLVILILCLLSRRLKSRGISTFFLEICESQTWSWKISSVFVETIEIGWVCFCFSLNLILFSSPIKSDDFSVFLSIFDCPT